MLSQQDRSVLDFERSWWMEPCPKEEAIRKRLHMSSTRYYQILNRLLQDPVAMEYDPLTIRRLLRLREGGRRQRVERRLSGTDARET
ncbi:MAG: DUF3263 domain-containing protein [Actinomycetota bacterium]|nr:DUF3263 domain-containing protein [Actinomycetota bacterium]